jgi:hypothetical protein
MSVNDFRFNYRRSIAIDHLTRRPILDTASKAPLEVFDPFIPCTLSSKTRCSSMEGLLDSGSDGMVIPRTVAEFLGLDLKPASEPMQVADGRDMDRYVSKIKLSIGRGGRFSDPVEVEVSIPAVGNPPVIIGRDPIFKQYRITFIEAEKRVEMKTYRKDDSQITSSY